MPAFGLSLLPVAISIPLHNANANTYVLAMRNALHAMQKLKQCGIAHARAAHGVRKIGFGSPERTCVYIYNPPPLYNWVNFALVHPTRVNLIIFCPRRIIRPLVTAIERGSLSPPPCVLVLTTVKPTNQIAYTTDLQSKKRLDFYRKKL